MEKIKGYRNLTEEEVAQINDIKGVSNQVGQFVDKIASFPGADPRWVAISKTDLQKGFMALTRSIAKPEGF